MTSSPTSGSARLPTFVENRLPVRIRRARAFETIHGHRPDRRHPRTFSEKVNYRVLYDRRPLLAPTCDKLAMKELARASGADVRIPRTYWSGSDLQELADVDLPPTWVLKPNHSTNARVIFGHGTADAAGLADRTQGWLDPDSHARGLGEWAYDLARRCLVAEERIDDGGRPPADIKVYVFDGTPQLVQVHADRFGRHTKRLYRADWTPLTDQPGYPVSPAAPRPASLDRLLDAAAALGAPYDFMRVDLYEADGVLWFGELTPYPSSGLRAFAPADLDREIGDLWTLPAEITPPGLFPRRRPQSAPAAVPRSGRTPRHPDRS